MNHTNIGTDTSKLVGKIRINLFAIPYYTVLYSKIQILYFAGFYCGDQ